MRTLAGLYVERYHRVIAERADQPRPEPTSRLGRALRRMMTP